MMMMIMISVRGGGALGIHTGKRISQQLVLPIVG